MEQESYDYDGKLLNESETITSMFFGKKNSVAIGSPLDWC